MEREEAIKNIKKLIGFSETLDESIHTLFPELEESNNEKIRKAIVTLIEDLQHYSTNYAGVDPIDMLAWLEKQKEQKPAEFDEYKIIKKHITEDSLSSEVNKRLTECGWYVTDEKPEEWSKEDEYRRKDAIYFLETARKHYADTSEIELTIDWLKSLKPQPKQDWMKEQKNKSM